MLKEIYETCKYVSDNSKYVKINYDVVDEFISGFKKTSFWLSSNPFNILDLDYKDIINVLSVYHTIGDYCLWGDPKWEIDTPDGKLDGSFAVLYLVINRYKDGKDFNMSFDEYKEWLKGKGELLLLKERYDELSIMNELLKDGNFYELIMDMKKDEDLFNYIIQKLPYYEDERNYNGKRVYFYKRAQLLVSDILHVREKVEKIDVDYSHLVGCADYKIPQVMNSLGMLQYDESLEKRIANFEEISLGEDAEIEIRANTLMVIYYIYKSMNEMVPRMDINDYIWLLGQDKSKMTKAYHRCKTVNY